MKIQMILPKWSMTMPWASSFPKVFAGDEIMLLPEPKLDLKPDAIMFMWCNKDTVQWINASNDTIPKIVFMRRYEFFGAEWGQVAWGKVAHLVFVNDVFKMEFDSVFEKPLVQSSVIYNPVDFNKFTFKKHAHGKKIAIVGNINERKNMPMALQIMAKLPQDYELHIIGAVQSPDTFMYTVYTASNLQRKVQVYGALDPATMNKVLDEMDYLLCTSISEGNPNSVNEGMAKGLKPLVHMWPGSVQQYPKECLFVTVDEAVKLIQAESEYDSEKYKNWAEERFSFKNIEKIRNIVISEVEKCAAIKQ